jgi:hypothetical protein
VGMVGSPRVGMYHLATHNNDTCPPPVRAYINHPATHTVWGLSQLPSLPIPGRTSSWAPKSHHQPSTLCHWAWEEQIPSEVLFFSSHHALP